jgi:hypothetical protein
MCTPHAALAAMLRRKALLLRHHRKQSALLFTKLRAWSPLMRAQLGRPRG